MSSKNAAAKLFQFGRWLCALALHPLVAFFVLLVAIALASHLLYLLKWSVSYPQIISVPHEAGLSSREEIRVSTSAQSLLTAHGMRDIYEGVISGFADFMPLALLVVSMLGIGVAEGSRLIDAAARALGSTLPGWTHSFLFALGGIACGVASETAFVVWMPITAMMYRRLGRNPLAGLALGYAAVAGALNLNMVVKPVDAGLTEIANSVIRTVDPSREVDLSAGIWFSIVAIALLAIAIAAITDRFVEPRLNRLSDLASRGVKASDRAAGEFGDEPRGWLFAVLGVIAVVMVFALISIPANAPLRNPDTSALFGNSPLMNQLIVPIVAMLIVAGAMYGWGAKTFRSIADVWNAMTQSISDLGGTIVLVLLASQLIAALNYSNLPTLVNVKAADLVMAATSNGYLMLVGFMIVVAVSSLFFTPAIPKWAIFAPIVVPLFLSRGIDPRNVLNAYRAASSPIGALTPFNAYFILVVGLAQKYDKNATVTSAFRMLLPYAVVINVLWLILAVAWVALKLPL